MRKNRQTAKYHIKSYIIVGSLAGAISMALALPAPVMAAQQSLASVTGQAQIQPMGDGSGKYMMKSDGFYCLDVNGAGSTQAEIHYFQDYEIDGTVFDGYYYHDADGKFKACKSRARQRQRARRRTRKGSTAREQSTAFVTQSHVVAIKECHRCRFLHIPGRLPSSVQLWLAA